MSRVLRSLLPWLLAWAAVALAGGAWLARLELQRLHANFDTEGRIAHRLLSQQVVQYDAVLSTLALLGGDREAGLADRPEQRLGAVHPAILQVQWRAPGAAWPDARLTAAEVQSRTRKAAVLARMDLAAGRYQLLMAAEPASYALDIDLAAAVPWQEWPADPHEARARTVLALDGQQHVLQPGRDAGRPGGWHFSFRKTLASASQPFEVISERRVGWAELPWGAMALWAAGAGAALAGLRAWQRQRTARRRAEELLRLGQVGRLNALGELAAGMAHELNQPLTAVLANAQAARRLLDEEPPDTATARTAMAQAAEQARRAAAVVARLRRAIERPEAGGPGRRAIVALQDVARDALHLLEPECARRQVGVETAGEAEPVHVLADPVAVEQIVHNLLLNALQALETLPPEAPRRVRLEVRRAAGQGLLVIHDSGPGIAPDLLPKIFLPFVSTREGGLGLGLSLSETLAAGQGGSLGADSPPGGGARFTLALPLAPAAGASPGDA
ncbi:sensor histidine kinase [Xenophilus sp. Marseille-Q4582]|uniref:sensor histidine kinase n=1 Tax=Xenophilus sp. Marseille-Q4582 TaxID=2866600 RepID=UPI001CE44C18|nr:ATP-binding protein [Xenophilus sp. Marseille-Q4582]